MPPKMKIRVNSLVTYNNYSSVSELFRDAFRALEDEKLVEGIMESEREFAAGKGKKLRSLRDLM